LCVSKNPKTLKIFKHKKGKTLSTLQNP
jgi:hypothetical protein